MEHDIDSNDTVHLTVTGELIAEVLKQWREERERQRGWVKRQMSVAKDGLDAICSGPLREAYGPEVA